MFMRRAVMAAIFGLVLCLPGCLKSCEPDPITPTQPTMPATVPWPVPPPQNE